MRGDEDARNLSNAWQKTLDFYASTFGEAASSELWTGSNRCPNCGRRCKKGARLPANQAVFDEKRPKLADIGLSL